MTIGWVVRWAPVEPERRHDLLSRRTGWSAVTLGPMPQGVIHRVPGPVLRFPLQQPGGAPRRPVPSPRGRKRSQPRAAADTSARVAAGVPAESEWPESRLSAPGDQSRENLTTSHRTAPMPSIGPLRESTCDQPAAPPGHRALSNHMILYFGPPPPSGTRHWITWCGHFVRHVWQCRQFEGFSTSSFSSNLYTSAGQK
jgi:hypothetical protein